MISSVAVPEVEMERLAALERLEILDTAPEPEFDELVQLAAAICDVPISLVSLVDEDRQWFKAAVGLASPETSRDISFCAHAIEQKEMFIVEDATLDDRFAENPLVTGVQNVRFYAGMPIHSPEGLAMGSLCVIDRKPRKLSRAQTEALRIIALQVNARLEQRLQRKLLEEALQESEKAHAELYAAKAELEVAHQKLIEISVTDSLTGLSNRRAFDERLASEMTTSKRRTDLSLLLLDIDHFKQLNDRFGHQAGDEALCKMGTILRHAVRGTDVAARYGGEEFAILLRDTSAVGALALANRILEAVRTAEWKDTPLTVSIGVAERLQGEPEGRVLLARADAALYRAKAGGRNRLVMHSDSSEEPLKV